MADIISTRRHRILDLRQTQIRRNLLSIEGGAPYIRERLHRAPNESDRSWIGVPQDNIVGRRDRAYLINDAGRIAQKINDYLFSETAIREGLDDAWQRNVTATGLSVNQYWQRASRLFSGSQWIWLQADRLTREADAIISIADKETSGDRIFWNIWTAGEVVDWCFDSAGELSWLITEQYVYDNSDPRAEADERTIRTLWERGSFERYDVTDGADTLITSGTISANVVPFVCLGIPSQVPWWFDDVELIQSALLNLESLNYENLVQTVFPQLVVPASLSEDLQMTLTSYTNNAGTVKELAREIIRGLEYPFIESPEDAGLTRYLMPPSGEMKIIPDNIDRLRKAIRDNAGLAMFTNESNQVQSAESKKWDHLDVEATLKYRSNMMQDAEARLVDISRQLDTSFSTYNPIWPSEFSIPDIAGGVDGLTKILNAVSLPPEAEKEARKIAIKLLDQIHDISRKRMDELLKEADTWEPEPLDLSAIANAQPGSQTPTD